MHVTEELKADTREELIIKCYEEVFPLAASHMQRMGGGLEEAKEVFQVAIVFYYEKLMDGDFQPEVGDVAYLMGIVKKQWLKYQEKSKVHQNLENIEIIDASDEKPLPKKILQYLKLSGKRCMDLLQSFYYEKLTMRQMADQYGYTSERSATVQKYKCLEKVRDEIKLKSIQYEDFFE